MRFTKHSILLISLPCLFIFVVWKTLSLMYQEKELYSEVLLKLHTIEDVLSVCLPDLATSDTADVPTNQIRRHQQKLNDRSCDLGSVFRDGTCISCPKGTFSFSNSIACENYLQCDQVHYEVLTRDTVFTVGNWNYKVAEWRGYEVLSASMAAEDREMFEPEIVKDLSPHPNMLYPIGFCRDEGIAIFWKTSSFKGPAHKLDSVLPHHPKCDHWAVRFRLTIDFVRILVHLHTAATDGPVVFCNSNSLEDTLSQVLVTNTWSLVLATFDNLPQIKKHNGQRHSLVKCATRELRGDFVAPEQKWPFSHTKVFNIDAQPGYTEAVDVWKVPDITKAILGNSEESRLVLNHLSFVHYRCKDFDPSARPTASELLTEYENVWKMLYLTTI